MQTEESKIEKIVIDVITRLMQIWMKGEGDLTIEVRNDGNEKKAKIKSGTVERI